MTVLEGEGRVSIIYGRHPLPAPPHREVYVARPNAVGRHPGVVVLHGDSGVTPSVRDLCRRIARHGYLAAAPDLFRDGEPGDLSIVAEGRAVSDGEDVVDALRGAWRGFTASSRPAVLALGASAGIAARLAGETRGPLVLLGGPVDRLEPMLVEFRAPVLGLVAGVENGSAAVRRLHEIVGRGEWVVYRGAGFEFFDDGTDDFDGEAYADAFDRLIAFLDRHLAPVGV